MQMGWPLMKECASSCSRTVNTLSGIVLTFIQVPLLAFFIISGRLIYENGRGLSIQRQEGKVGNNSPGHSQPCSIHSLCAGFQAWRDYHSFHIRQKLWRSCVYTLRCTTQNASHGRKYFQAIILVFDSGGKNIVSYWSDQWILQTCSTVNEVGFFLQIRERDQSQASLFHCTVYTLCVHCM